MASVQLTNVSKIFRPKRSEEVHAVRNLDLTVADGAMLVLVGPSGCGKTTTLRLIAGLDEPSAGEILIDGAAMNRVPPQDRNVTMVFQRDALYPHMTAAENLAFGLKLRKVSRDECEARVKSIAATLGIVSLLDRLPRSLSGGERQRVALGRALVRRPTVLLLDEPLSHLDALLRLQLRAEILRLHRELRVTMLYVTHDQAEAIAFNQPIAVMNNGAVEQVALPATLREEPASEFVANFFSEVFR